MFPSVQKKKCCVTSSTAGGCKELQSVSHWLLSGLCVRRVWCVESVAAAVGSTVALIMQVLQVLRGGGGGKDFSLPGSSGPEGQHAQAKEKADWLHILSVFVPVWTSFSLLSIEGGDFPLSLISTVEHHGGGE